MESGFPLLSWQVHVLLSKGESYRTVRGTLSALLPELFCSVNRWSCGLPGFPSCGLQEY